MIKTCNVNTSGNIQLEIDYQPSIILLFGTNIHDYSMTLVYTTNSNINIGSFNGPGGMAPLTAININYYNKTLSFNLWQDSYGNTSEMYVGEFTCIFIK